MRQRGRCRGFLSPLGRTLRAPAESVLGGGSWALTAMLTATSAGERCCRWIVGRLLGAVQSVVEAVDGLALEAEAYVGVDAGRDADVGVAEEFLDDDEVYALLQKQGGG